MSAMKTLAAVLEILDTYSQSDSKCVAEIVQKMVLLPRLSQIPLPFTKKNCSQENVSNAQVGSIVSSFISSKWECQKFMFRQAAGGSLKFDMVEVLDQAMEDLGLGSGSSDVAVFQALEVVMTELLSVADPNNVVKLMELSWCNVLEEKKNVLFWRKLRALLPLFLHQAVLRQSPDSVIGQGLDKFLEKTCELGYDKTGVMFIVFDHLCQHSLKGDTDRQMAMRVVPLLVDGCFSGAMHKKGERLWLDVCAYIESLGNSCSVNQIMTSMSRNDMFTRIIILNWLSELRPDVPADRNFALTLITSLRAKYLDLAAQTTYKQFSNSLSHRHKHRMVLVFLLLADFIKKDTCQDYIAKLWHALEIECHPSVRQNLEWLVILLISRFPHNVSSVWDVFKLYDNKRSVCLCSLFLIISHLGPKLPANLQSQYFTQAFSTILPWTMAHHYNTRIFAQTTVVRLWEQCQSLQLKDVITQFFMVESSINFIFSNGNASATVSKLLSNYMYAAFDAVRDYSMETIFHTLPRLACLADDEWILPKYFIQGNNSWAKGDNHLLPLRNSSPLLAQCKEGPWRTKAQAENDDDIVESADGDVQKKIMPWRQMSPDQETEAELVMQRQKRAEGGLVLVTSLIDKIPNLGGLCRTSEIFGVSEFVIGNLTYVEDRMFQNLSVSAQKWITITEVLRPRLSEFLEEKRVQGYTLVGVEQTANSVCLQEYQFPKKTLLLLGNEREGIPVDIIQNLDVCVEIPQQGVIRSLNVHVCGALIVWEYTRQHMKNMKA